MATRKFKIGTLVVPTKKAPKSEIARADFNRPKVVIGIVTNGRLHSGYESEGAAYMIRGRGIGHFYSYELRRLHRKRSN